MALVAYSHGRYSAHPRNRPTHGTTARSFCSSEGWRAVPWGDPHVLTAPTSWRVSILSLVSRVVTIVGDPTYLPLIKPQEAPRAFRVVAGGYLTIHFVTLHPGVGMPSGTRQLQVS